MHLPFSRLHLNPSHHLLLGDQMVDALQQAQQAPHAATPLVEHLVRVPGLGETDHPSRPIDLRIHRLRRDQLADVLLRLLLIEIEELTQSRHGDTGVVFGDDTDIVLDDAFAEVEVAGVGFGVVDGVCLRGGEDVGGAKVGAEFLRDDGPAHEFGDREEFQEGGFGGDEGVAGVEMDAVEEVGLLIVMGREDDVVNYSLKDLAENLSYF